jgi:hypothetical protein
MKETFRMLMTITKVSSDLRRKSLFTIVVAHPIQARKTSTNPILIV